MPRRRSRLRLPAFLASLLWLATGVADAAALSACAYHGTGGAHGGAGHGSDSTAPASDDGQEASQSGDAAHHQHGERGAAAELPHEPPGGTGVAGDYAASCDCEGSFLQQDPPDAFTAGTSSAEDGCRLVCVAAVQASPVEPSVAAVPDAGESNPVVLVPLTHQAPPSSVQFPYFLPPSIAPPTS